MLWSLPSGLYVLGSSDGERRNLMTLNWASQVSADPKLVAVGVEKAAVTHGLVDKGRCFSLNIIGRDDRAAVRKFVKPLTDEGDPASLGGFEVTAAVTGAPILAIAVAWLDCTLWQQVDCGSHTLFLGEIVDCGAATGDLDRVEVLRMEDTRMNYGG